MPCGNEEVRISLAGDPLFFPSCDDDPENPIYETTKFYLFGVIFEQGLVTPTYTQGAIGQISPNSELRFTLNSNSYLSSPTFQVNISGLKRRLDNGQFVTCYSQSFVIYPKKKAGISGYNFISEPGLYTYTATSIPGVTWSWTVPPGWNIVSSTANTISVMTGTTNGNITATPSQPLYGSCGAPYSLYVTLSDCALSGTTDFEFCTPANNWTTSFVSSQYGDEENAGKLPRMKGDFNGDGKTDLIGFGQTSVAVGLSTGSAFNVSTWTNLFTWGTDGFNQASLPRYLGDFNGDGKDDIVGFGHSSTTVALSTGSSFSTSGFTPSSFFTYSQGFTGTHLPRKVGDFNGDGKDDIIGFGHSSVSVGLSTGSSFNVSGWGASSFSTTTGGFGDEDKWPRMLGDFNGDGKTDIIGFGNTAVIVGLSTGSSFNVSTWGSPFTYGLSGILQSSTPRGIGDFNGDGKDDIILFGESAVSVALSTGSSFSPASTWIKEGFVGQYWENPTLQSLSSTPIILIEDMNADGKDDLIGFNGYGTAISYSTGSLFECPAKHGMMVLGSTTYNNDPRFVGNFDNTDDLLEIVAINDNQVEVLNCKTCTTSVADLSVNGHYSKTTESGYQGWNMDVYRFCSNTLSIDVSGTECEDAYFVNVTEFNLSTFATGNTILATGWIMGKAPDNIDLSSLNLVPGQMYRVEYGVGPQWNTKDFCVLITDPSAGFTLNPNETRTVGWGAFTNTVNGFCSNILSTPVDAATSTCYEEYRYEVQEVTPPLMTNTGSVLQQIPVGGGWNLGPAALNNVNVSNFASGKIYAIRLFVRRNGITSSYTRYAERTGCVIGTPPKEIGFMTSVNNGGNESLLYPNPALNNITLNIIDYGVPVVNGSIYDSYGRCIRSLELNGNSHNTLDISSLAPGLYFMMLQANGNSEKISFIKQ